MPNRNRTFISLATKNALVYFLLTLLGLAVLGFLLFKNSAKEIIKLSEQQVAHANENISIKFASFIGDVKRDIAHLSSSPFLKEYLLDNSNKNKSLLSEEYLTIIKSKPDYSQIRLIGAENDGREIVRAERLAERIFLVQEDSLQKKGDRSYFVETANLATDSIYFSVIDYNKEFGEISIPPTPTLRAASPIFVGDEFFGIIIINVNLLGLFEDLNSLVGRQYELKIVNSDGYFLIHPNSNRVFSFEYNRPPEFQNDFGQSLESTVQKFESVSIPVAKEGDYLFSFRSLGFPKNDYHIYSIIGAGEKEILSSFYSLRRESLVITFGLALFVLILVLLYMRRQANELKNITATMVAFPKSMVPAKLPINRNDEIGQLAKSFEEMSEIITANLDEIKNAKKDVELAIQEKDAFLENMSHEIRNPIHSIIGMTHLLEKNNPGRHQHAFIESLKFNSKNLLSLVNDILDYKKLSIGEIQINPEWLSLPALIKEISNSHKFSAVSKKIKLETHVSESLSDAYVFFDPIRLTQIVNNLVINAIKFTNENGVVSINVEVVEKKDDYLKIKFAIKDSGIGIGEANIAKIIERHFTEAKKENQFAFPGVGLGLPIVVQLLKLFSSKLNIESVVDKGSCFSFCLESPFQLHENTVVGKNDESLYAVMEDADVLVVDDDEQILLLYEHMFENRVNRLKKILNIRNVIELATESFDIVISDFHFNNESILSYTEDLKTVVAENGNLYIVSGTDSNDKLSDSKVTVKHVFKKPVDPEELIAKVALDFASNKFGVPDLKSIEKDYDNDGEKIKRAIGLLIDEWKKMLKEIEIAGVNNDKEKYIALHHKLITSVRRLQLDKFETVLNIPIDEVESPIDDAVNRIKKMMSFYIWYLVDRSSF